MTVTPNRPMADFINQRLTDLSDRKNQRTVAQIAGYVNQNMITHLKNGTAKLSLDRVPDLANALEVDPRQLLKLAILQYVGDEQRDTIERLLDTVVTDKELAFVRYLRKAAGDQDIVLNDRMRNAIDRAVAETNDDN